jgi:hypothetical protein
VKRIPTVIKSLREADTEGNKESYLKRIHTVIKNLRETDTDRYKEST